MHGTNMKTTKKLLWNYSLYRFFQFLTCCFSKDLTVRSLPFSVTSTVKLRISVRNRDRSIDGSENRRRIEQAHKHYTLCHTHTILIILHTTVYGFTYKRYIIGEDWTTNVVLITRYTPCDQRGMWFSFCISHRRWLAAKRVNRNWRMIEVSIILFWNSYID